MRARLRPAAAAAAVVASFAAAGCGEQRGNAAATTPEPVGPPVTIDPRVVAIAELSLVEYAIRSPGARVANAGRIAFSATNDGLVRHALAVDGPSGTERTPALAPGERAVLTVRLPAGTYKWYCPIADHEQRGMTGRVRIAE
ncbi:MAG: hypothetical protein ACLGI5_05875 [Thermoleophilia bacterium]